ncbi:MAG TPA: hypothetical protein VMT58_02650 [Candidatus Binataceae bacterium]|nr:hypothetical protein [Candidatus Binataceae bacterium]
MPHLSAETVQRVMKDLYGYEIPLDRAAAVANMTGALLTLAEHMTAGEHFESEPPFSYPLLISEADRIAKSKDSARATTTR